MIFAFLHATLGWLLAALAAWALRRRSADARCWAWRLGLLKGPLALLLAVPVFVPGTLLLGSEGAEVKGKLLVEAPSATGKGGWLVPPSPVLPKVTKAWAYSSALPPNHLPPLSLPLFPFPYLLGVAAALLVRFRLRRPHRAMPRVVGVLRPRVVIPDGLSPEDTEIALAHETAHVRRRDLQWSFIADLVCAALWFAPPVWLCARAMRLESEAACDSAALQETGAAKAAYARLLLAFAGPAPALALGGPARRLARRIRMLERNPKPLPRLAVVTLVAMGFATLLPWQAVAKAPTASASTTDRLPARSSLAKATDRLLGNPETVADLGLSPDQQATLRLRTYQGNLRRLAMRKRDAISNLKKFPVGSRNPMAQATRVELSRVTKDIATTERSISTTKVTPLTVAQQRRLVALALDRFGSAIWEDPAVASALGLTGEQFAAVKAQNDEILTAMRRDRSAGEFAYMVGSLRSEARKTGLTLERKKAIDLQIRAYQAMAERFRPIFQEQAPQFWRMRGAADARLEAGLTADQRRVLDKLRNDPSAWKGAEWRIDRTGDKPPYRYQVERVPRSLSQSTEAKERL